MATDTTPDPATNDGDVPAAACHQCGEPIRIWSPFDEIGETLELSCDACGHVAEYARDEILTAEALNGLVKKEGE
jgi:hypothetical protein